MNYENALNHYELVNRYSEIIHEKLKYLEIDNELRVSVADLIFQLKILNNQDILEFINKDEDKLKKIIEAFFSQEDNKIIIKEDNLKYLLTFLILNSEKNESSI